ncbi:MAG: hypothetical protein KF824_00795 [Fimbriimonadaceae bacterium]|nr:MAG: hypothetical protein KF824_00795 [Fimbriimonadaceae bacterium]
MNDFRMTWELSRGRFIESFSNLNHEQLNWQMHPNTLTIAEMAMHVAGVEVSFASQLLGTTLTPEQELILSCSTQGVVNDEQFPVAPELLKPEYVKEAMNVGKGFAEALFEQGEGLRQKELKSALGPMITGEGAFARLAMHALYHQGQVYLMITDPRFPK